MTDYTALKVLWPTLSPGTTDQKLTAVNIKTATMPIPARISVSELIAAFDPAELVTLTTPQLLVIQIMLFNQSSVDVSPGTALRAGLTALFASKPNTKAALIVLQQKYDAATVPWWKANGYPREFDLGDIAEAGLS